MVAFVGAGCRPCALPGTRCVGGCLAARMKFGNTAMEIQPTLAARFSCGDGLLVKIHHKLVRKRRRMICGGRCSGARIGC